MRILKIYLAVLVPVVLGFSLFVYFHVVAPQRAHLRAMHRILDVIHRGDTPPPPGLDANSWHNYLGAPHNAVYNIFSPRDRFPTAKLEELAARFEATWPEGPKTSRDVLDMVEVMSAALPTQADYEPFEAVRRWFKEEQPPPGPAHK